MTRAGKANPYQLAGYGEVFARELKVEDFGDEEGAIRIVEESEMSQSDFSRAGWESVTCGTGSKINWTVRRVPPLEIRRR